MKMSNSDNVVFDIREKMNQRLEETNIQKERTQIKINEYTEQLQKILSKVKKNSCQTSSQLDSKIEDLEKRRTINSLPLAAEKEILRQIAAIKRSKEQLKEYAQHEAVIQEKKTELSTLRDNLRKVIAQQTELEDALAKLELAKRLGCTTSDLLKRVVNCPDDKLGQVIGKNGSNIKQLEQKTGCTIDINKITCQIQLHGSESAIANAVEELEKITLSIVYDLKLSSVTHSYLFAMRMAAFTSLQKEHPHVYFDLSKESKTMHLRGKPSIVAAAKESVLAINVTEATRSLNGRETAIVLGKSGVTVNKLVDDFQVGISISSSDADKSTAVIVGPENNVRQAMLNIDDIIYKNEEVEESLAVSSTIRNKLLSDSGALMKNLQRKVNEECEQGNALLFFEKISKEDSRSFTSSLLLVKAPRMFSGIAKDIVSKQVNILEASVLSIKVDPDIIPSIIGKGGAKINELRKIGLGSEIDIDKKTGNIKVFSDDEKTKTQLRNAISGIVSENQVLKVAVDSSMLGLIFGESGKQMREKILSDGVYILNDNSNEFVILRGKIEQTTLAEATLLSFLESNYTSDLDFLPEDDFLLFVGGSESILSRLQSQCNVKINVLKSRHLLTFRGTEENVVAAKKRMNLFLFGGDGIIVQKMRIPDNVLGIIIGRGGNNISKLESEYKHVKIYVKKEWSLLCFRGPEDQVNICRGEVIQTIATVKVTETVHLSSAEYNDLYVSDALRKIVDGIPIQTTFIESSLRLRGMSSDVSDVKAQIEDFITGAYSTYIDLDPSHFEKVYFALNDQVHFDRIRKSTNTAISLDKIACAVEISGKRSNVKKAKVALLGFLEFLLPSQFCRVKVMKPLVKSIADAHSLAKIAAESHCTLKLDRDVNCILIRSSSTGNLPFAVDLVNSKIKECEKLSTIIRFQPIDSWLFSRLLLNNGERIKKIQDDGECILDIFKDDLMVSISAENEESVIKTKNILELIIAKMRKENVFIDIPGSAISSFIGKSGSNIKNIGQKYGVQIERMRKYQSRIQIQGNESSVHAAFVAVSSWIRLWELENIGKSPSVKDKIIQDVHVKNRHNVQAIEKDFNVNDTSQSTNIICSSDKKEEEEIETLNDIICEGRLMTDRQDKNIDTEENFISASRDTEWKENGVQLCSQYNNICGLKKMNVVDNDTYQKTDSSTNKGIKSSNKIHLISDGSNKNISNSTDTAKSLFSLLVSDENEPSRLMLSKFYDKGEYLKINPRSNGEKN